MQTTQTHTYKKIKLRYHQKILLDLLKKKYPKKKDGNALDIGCANGIFLKKFNSYFRKFQSLGLDTSKDMVSFAKKKKFKI
tara:strand:+ start:405 stop:647 length:243 start_codon:yes stop_codon:yes gene_type:complete